MTPPAPPPPPPPLPAKRHRSSDTSPNTTTRTATTTPPLHALGAPTSAPEDESSGDGAGWLDKLEAWGSEESGGEPDWTTWVLDDEARYPPLARARHAGLRDVLQVVKRHLSAAKEHAADVLSREDTVAAEEALQLSELLDDIAVQLTSTALDSIRCERLAQDAHFVANGGQPLDLHQPLA
ncbi:hypothetical protein JCM8097_004733 [Rhodosporidiobolus ruineniae]